MSYLNQLPVTDRIVNPGGQATVEFRQWIQAVTWLIQAQQRSGATADRPRAGVVGVRWVGMSYFDTDLGKPVYLKSANPDVWVDADGGVV